MNINFKARKKSIILSVCIILVLVAGGFTVKTKLNNKAPELIKYSSQEYQYVKKADREILGSAQKNTKATGKFVGSMEIYTYDSDSSLLYLKSNSGDYLIYHTLPLP